MSDLQSRIFAELRDKAAFEAAQAAAFDYLDTMLARPVAPGPDAIARLASFDEPLPEHGMAGTELIARLHRDGAPATVTTAGGRHFGLVTGAAIPAAVAARWLGDAWDQNAVLYRLSPIAAKLESVCERWLAQAFGLPDETVLGLVSGSSTAIFCGLAAGRQHLFGKRGWDVNARGLNGAPPLRVVASAHAHSTVLKAVALLGLGTDSIEWAEVDDQGRVRPDRLPALDPSTLLILQAGNVNGGGFDPFDPICGCARDAGAWVHVDGAFGLWAAASGRLAHLTRGMERADSWSADGHKTLNTPYGVGMVLCRRPAALAAAMQMSASYITLSDQREPMTYTPEMSRPARAIETWATLAFLGREGLDSLVWQLHERAVQMAGALGEAGFVIANDIVFNQLIVEVGDERTTRAMIAWLQDSGECWVGGATWFGRPIIRVSICSWATTRDDIARAAAAFVAARAAVLESVTA